MAGIGEPLTKSLRLISPRWEDRPPGVTDFVLTMLFGYGLIEYGGFDSTGIEPLIRLSPAGRKLIR